MDVFRARSASRTDKGNVRQINEDSCLDLPAKGLWVVADGMGGHAAGDIASRMIVDSLRSVDRHESAGSRPSQALDELEDALLEVNRRLYAKAQEGDAPAVIGSTVISLLAFPAHCVLVWAGDSRAYRLRAGQFTQLTQDHSEVQDLITRGELRPEDAEAHESANVVTRAVGGTAELYVDVAMEELADGDRYLLCSDGLYKELSHPELAIHLATGDAGEACDALVSGALAKAGGDNVTVIVVDFHREGAPAEAPAVEIPTAEPAPVAGTD